MRPEREAGCLCAVCSASRSAFPRQPQTLDLAFFVVPLDDGEQRDRGADNAEGADHFQERAQRHANVSGTEPGTWPAWFRIGRYRKASGTEVTWVMR
jgi:hypothetical protein